MKRTPYFLLIIILVIIMLMFMLSCATRNENVAGVKHFYFEFDDQVKTEYSLALIDQISEQLPKYDYLISEESGAEGWPFYASVDRGSRVLKSEMVPPHSNVNRLSAIEYLPEDMAHGEDEHLMKLIVELKAMDNGVLILDKQSFKWKNNQWEVFSMKIESQFRTDEKPVEEVADKIAKTLTRYTFK